MQIKENVSLAAHSTMRLGGRARWLAEARSDEEVEGLAKWAKDQNLLVLMIGSGSNIVWRDEGFDGLIIVNEITGKQILIEDKHSVTIFLGAGENWDKAVAWTVSQGWSGIEFLSLIPGTVGAAPVQNIGAYGGELARVLIEVGVYDTKTSAFSSIPASQCAFTYRSSRFKTTDKGRFMITHIIMRLQKSKASPPFYDSLQSYFDQHSIHDYSPANIRQAVIAIRSAKLPDPKHVANNGSFFVNPVINKRQFKQLQKRYADIKGWPTKDGRVKVAAGWLVEQAGFKGVHDAETGMATWPAQALVLVNERARSTGDLLAFKQKIIDKVGQMFAITLEQEPELLP